MIWEITYVTFTFKNKKGKDVEKIKTCKVYGVDKAEAERNFLNKNIKFKNIKSITKDTSNSIANLCPELIKMRNKIKN